MSEYIPRVTGRTVVRLTVATLRIGTIVSHNRRWRTTNVTAFP